jgi:hypothetical protein
MQSIVGIERKQIWSSSGSDSGISRIREAAVRLTNEANALSRILFDQLGRNCCRIVRTSIVDDHTFPVAIGLRDDAGHGLREKMRLLITRNDDRHLWDSSGPLSRRSQ